MADRVPSLIIDAFRAQREGPAGLERRSRRRLADLVSHARQSSPFYRSLYRGLPDRLEDVALLPVVNKQTLMARFDDWVTDPAVTADAVHAFVADPALVGQRLLGRYQAATTSGTTGHRGLFLIDDPTLTVATAITVRMLLSWLTARDVLQIVRGGGRLTMVVATGGHFATAVAATKLRTSPLRPRLISVLPVHTAMPDLVAKLNGLQPTILAPYATVGLLLAAEQSAGRLLITPALVVLAAEGLSDTDRHRVVDAFPTAQVVSSYAATECPFLSYSCPAGWQHVNSDWAILEPVTADHQPVPPGQLSDTALVTNLANRLQPILRYNLGDQVLANPDPCPCGSPLPAVRVRGRAADLVTFPDAHHRSVTLPPLALSSLADRVPGLDLVQIVQTTPTTLSVRIRPRVLNSGDPRWIDLSGQLTRLLTSHQLGHVSVQLAEEEPQPTPGGKYRSVIPLPSQPVSPPMADPRGDANAAAG